MKQGSIENIGELFGEALVRTIRSAIREELMAIVGVGGIRPTESKPRDYLTVKQASVVSGLGASTIRLYIRKRALRAQQVGRRVLVKRSDLEKFLEKRPIEAMPED